METSETSNRAGAEITRAIIEEADRSMPRCWHNQLLEWYDACFLRWMRFCELADR